MAQSVSKYGIESNFQVDMVEGSSLILQLSDGKLFSPIFSFTADQALSEIENG